MSPACSIVLDIDSLFNLNHWLLIVEGIIVVAVFSLVRLLCSCQCFANDVVSVSMRFLSFHVCEVVYDVLCSCH